MLSTNLGLADLPQALKMGPCVAVKSELVEVIQPLLSPNSLPRVYTDPRACPLYPPKRKSEFP